MSEKYLNREVGWLEFNERVLAQAADSKLPLLERVRFLSIYNSNLDEFYMKRVGGLKKQLSVGYGRKSMDGLSASEQLEIIRKIIQAQQEKLTKTYFQIRRELEKNQIFLLNRSDLTQEDIEQMEHYFKKNVFPVLTPLAVDPGHPFPFISNMSTSLGVTLRHKGKDETLFARVKVPKILPQWVRIDTADDPNYRFVRLSDLIIENLDLLFNSMEVVGVLPFRVLRNAAIERDEEDAEDLLEMIEEELRQRRFAEVIRLEYGKAPDGWMLDFLCDELELTEFDLYKNEGELDYTDLNTIADLDLPDLKFKPWSPVTPPALADESSDIFHLIRNSDILVHHPYESYATSVERFIREAADDPKVLAIKMTLYRTGDDSPIVRSLIQAAEAGKQVVCLIELKARFDEARNIYWAQELENAGIHVVYGIVGLKTHSKLTLAVRNEGDGPRCYCHIGTGNYNSITSRFYTDVGLLTCRESITSEVVELFHYLTGRSMKEDFDELLVAPINMADRFIQHIETEISNAKRGLPAQIIAKFNNMYDKQITKALYRASQAGVQVHLIVRGFCCLRPQVPGLSENIHVISIIGRFLEHSRLFYFQNGHEDPAAGTYYIGSADWMARNLHGRVEVITPIHYPPHKEKLWSQLQIMLTDQKQAWDMDSEGKYTRRKGEKRGSQQLLMDATKYIAESSEED